jgi:N,N'-diacetyllegionaminate synthase
MVSVKKKLYIIAEAGSVHDGSFGNACKLIELAADSGADAVKFQTHFGDAESLPNAKRPSYFKNEDRILYFNRTQFSFEQYKKFIILCKKKKIHFLSSPFSIEAVDFLEKLNLSSYKIPSGEVTNHPLLERIARTRKKVFLSTGMSNWKEIDAAVKILNRKNQLTLMQCTSMYPCSPKRVGINIINEMKKRYNLSVGFSDHTTGFVAAIGAVFTGATVIEKHITFSKFMYGSDAFNALEPKEFKNFCKFLNEAFEINNNRLSKDDILWLSKTKKVFEKSIVSSRNITKNSKLKLKDLSFKKPGDGISAARYKEILGLKLIKNIKKNKKILFKHLKK